jgi:hypothetical protein
MKTKEVTEVLKSLGWVTRKDSVGDSVASFQLSDRELQIIYGVRQIYDQQLEAMCSTSTDAFSYACLTIRHGTKARKVKLTHGNLVVRDRNPKYIAPEILESHVILMSEEVIAWAHAQDLDKGLQEYAALNPEECLGNTPVKHLAALAILGDLEKLKFYQSRFEAGDRLGFVPYIGQDFIDRAVELAEKKLNNG